MNAFEEGYEYFSNISGIQVASEHGAVYEGNIENEIQNLIDDLNAMNGMNSPIDTLKGDIAEFWHSDTFNINAAVKSSDHRTFVDRSHDFASVDVSSNFGSDNQLKYYKTGAKSAEALAKSFKERYKNYIANGGTDTEEEWLKKRGYGAQTNLDSPIYHGQTRILPKDQLQEAIDWLNKKIIKESANRPEQVERYKDTLKMLTDKISDGEGVESIALTEKEAKELAKLAEEGGISEDLLKELGVSADQLIQFEDILRESFKAGMSAATISMVLKVAPEVYKAITFLIKNGELEEDQFQRIGFAALQGASEGFVRGNISAALTISCRSGLLGETWKQIDPSIIGAVTVIVMDTMKNAFFVATGKMKPQDMTEALIKEMYVTTCSLIGGGITQGIVQIPVFGYMLGSFLGSVVGAFTYDIGYNIAISFCVDTGFTMFGLVDQDYELPEEVLIDIGVDVFEYEKFEPETIDVEDFALDTISFEEVIPESLNIKILRRGVIGVRKIGYV